MDIKLKAWDKKQKKILKVVSMSHGAKNWHVKVEELSVFSIGKGRDGNDIYPYLQREISENDNILVLSTGLFDRNGKEISDGDINMNNKNQKSEVIFKAGGSNCLQKPYNIRRAPKCPKCGSGNTSLKEDDRDEWADLFILCFKCGYDEREIKHNNADTLKAWQKIADNRIKQLKR